MGCNHMTQIITWQVRQIENMKKKKKNERRRAEVTKKYVYIPISRKQMPTFQNSLLNLTMTIKYNLQI